MFTDIRSRLGDLDIQELIALSVFPGEDEPARTIEQYKSEGELHILGYESEEELVGFVGFKVNAEQIMSLLHIAVLPEYRGAGFGRGMILELLHEYQPHAIIAETDEESAHFFRNIGFRIESIGENEPGIERFRCLFEAQEHEDE